MSANINLKSVHWINVCVRVLSVMVLLYLCNQSLKSTNLKPDVFKFIIFWSCSLEMSAYTSDTADIYLCFCCAHKSEDIWCRHAVCAAQCSSHRTPGGFWESLSISVKPSWWMSLFHSLVSYKVNIICVAFVFFMYPASCDLCSERLWPSRS